MQARPSIIKMRRRQIDLQKLVIKSVGARDCLPTDAATKKK